MADSYEVTLSDPAKEDIEESGDPEQLPTNMTVTLKEAKEMESRTDWEALEEKTDEQIRKDVESDPDAYFLGEDWFEAATFFSPSAEK